LLTIHLEIFLTNTNLTLEIVLLMFFCTSHIAPKNKKNKKNYMRATKHKIQDQTLVTTWVWFVIILVMFGSIPHPASHALFQPKTRLKPWILSTSHITLICVIMWSQTFRIASVDPKFHYYGIIFIKKDSFETRR
jgi:hypothetical protein